MAFDTNQFVLPTSAIAVDTDNANQLGYARTLKDWISLAEGRLLQSAVAWLNITQQTSDDLKTTFQYEGSNITPGSDAVYYDTLFVGILAASDTPTVSIRLAAYDPADPATVVTVSEFQFTSVALDGQLAIYERKLTDLERSRLTDVAQMLEVQASCTVNKGAQFVGLQLFGSNIPA